MEIYWTQVLRHALSSRGSPAGSAHDVRRTRSSSSRISSTAPIVIALSATLNDGK